MPECLWCDASAPLVADIREHQVEAHGARKMACGCKLVEHATLDGIRSWSACDDHLSALAKQEGAFIIENYERGVFRPEPAAQQALDFSGVSHG